jgi:hypothetical protein
MIITLVLGTIKGHSKMRSFVTQHNATGLRERAIDMLTAGMSTRAVARELNAHFSTNVVLENVPGCSTGLTSADHM